MSILVTGATGLVGSALTRQLVEDGARVRILRRASSKLDLLGVSADHVEHAIGDVTDAETLRPALEGVQDVYHTAAYLGFGQRRDDERLFRVNVEGTANVVDAALAVGAERLVHTSSIAALGRTRNTDQVIDEATPWRTSRINSQYARSKYEAEREVQRGIAEGLDAVIVNPSLIFGLTRAGENTRQIAERVRDGKIPAIPTGGTNAVDVEDVALGHRLAMQHGQTGERYLLGGENLTWRALFEMFAEAFGVKPPRRTLGPRGAMMAATCAEALAFLTRTRPLLTREVARNTARHYQYSNRKAIEELGCTFRPFRETAARLAAVFQAG